IPMNEAGELQLENLAQLIDERTRMVAVVHISNSLGTINPIETIIAEARRKNAPILIDGAQSVAHQPIDVQAMDCDFFVFSGHKLFGPTGIGVLYGKPERLEAMLPYQFGGDMIRMVSFEKTVFSKLPQKLEAGTPNIAGAIGLAKAIEYVQTLGLENIQQYTSELLQYATAKLSAIDGLRIVGNAPHKSSIISFLLDEVHPHDIGTILGEAGIAIRAGHHCTQPAMQFFGIPGTARASFSIYNTTEEIDQLVLALHQVKTLFQ
ncbi:MAG: cysteine desulfurase, partial [Bacteroidota bacterium]